MHAKPGVSFLSRPKENKSFYRINALTFTPAAYSIKSSRSRVGESRAERERERERERESK